MAGKFVSSSGSDSTNKDGSDVKENGSVEMTVASEHVSDGNNDAGWEVTQHEKIVSSAIIGLATK